MTSSIKQTATPYYLSCPLAALLDALAGVDRSVGLTYLTDPAAGYAQRAGEMVHINVLGLATIAQDVTPELARATIASVSVLGALHATPAVKAALSDRTR